MIVVSKGHTKITFSLKKVFFFDAAAAGHVGWVTYMMVI
jgi:hypothetical protein